jgi:hypothetical protein
MAVALEPSEGKEEELSAFTAPKTERLSLIIQG